MSKSYHQVLSPINQNKMAKTPLKSVGSNIPVKLNKPFCIQPNQPQPPKSDAQIALAKEIPEVIFDSGRQIKYERARFLGKGGFARCYEVKSLSTGDVLACKIVSKNLLIKSHQREKMAQEISIHRGLSHEFIVKFFSYFEDDLNVYVNLELCTKKSLMELQKRRRVITEPEARYFFHQINLAVKYLHDEKIIHRDLKLSNVFINEEMKIKIGDFGLATVCEFHTTKRFTLCGTPNYLAPEIIAKKGHSFEVDIWSMGCILYTLLIGTPPFETSSLKETYAKISKAEFAFPTGKITLHARAIINKMLSIDPTMRPTATQLLNSDFFSNGIFPKTLPSTVLTMAPRFDSIIRREEKEKELAKSMSKVPQSSANNERKATPTSNVKKIDKPKLSVRNMNCGKKELLATPLYLRSLYNQLKSLTNAMPLSNNQLKFSHESEDPSASPLLWISKWVDYSDKFGFGFQLTDDSVGVRFNDETRMILLPDSSYIQYMDKDGNEEFHPLSNYPKHLGKKVKLITFFKDYMSEKLVKSGNTVHITDYSMARLPTLWTWFRTTQAVVMVLSNGTLQINNFINHSKIILCPHLSAISILEPSSKTQVKTFRFSFLKTHGYTKELAKDIGYAMEKLELLVYNGNGSMKSPGPDENQRPN